MLQNGKIKGLIFDCYKTLIDIKTDEGSWETNEKISRWLLYQGVRIDPKRLRDCKSIQNCVFEKIGDLPSESAPA
jgi:putative hydrolase of the HAD superfamily